MADMVLPHIERLFKCSECRTPLICCLENGDPQRSIEAMAKRRGSAVWKIAMDTPKNERNALDYLEVGLANGDWLFLVQCEKASIAVMREIALQLVQVNPDPKNHPRRGEFRLWLLVEHPIDINDNINSIFPAILTQNALYGWRDAASNRSRVMAKGKVDPEMVEEEDKKRVGRVEHGKDPDDQSDDEDAQKKVTGMWFHRTVDFYQADAENEVTRNVEDIFTAIQKGEVAKVKEICGKNNVDLNLITHAELTPLMWAVLCDNIELVRVLLEHGADPNRRRESGHASTNGKLPIFMSLESPEMLQLLIDYGADIDARWEGYVLADHPDTAPDIKEYLHRLNQS